MGESAEVRRILAKVLPYSVACGLIGYALFGGEDYKGWGADRAGRGRTGFVHRRSREHIEGYLLAEHRGEVFEGMDQEGRTRRFRTCRKPASIGRLWNTWYRME